MLGDHSLLEALGAQDFAIGDIDDADVLFHDFEGSGEQGVETLFTHDADELHHAFGAADLACAIPEARAA